jgi:hypothetical protein
MKKKYTLFIALLLLPVHISPMAIPERTTTWAHSGVKKLIDATYQTMNSNPKYQIGNVHYTSLREYFERKLKIYVSTTCGLCCLGIIAYQIVYNTYS